MTRFFIIISILTEYKLKTSWKKYASKWCIKQKMFNWSIFSTKKNVQEPLNEELKGLRPEKMMINKMLLTTWTDTNKKNIGSDNKQTTRSRYHKREWEMFKKSWTKDLRGSAQNLGLLKRAMRERDRTWYSSQSTGNKKVQKHCL